MAHLTTRASAALLLGLSLALTGCQNIAASATDASQAPASAAQGGEAAEDEASENEAGEDEAGEAEEPAASEQAPDSSDPAQTDQSTAADPTDPTNPADPADPTDPTNPAETECSGLTGEEAISVWGHVVPTDGLDPEWAWDLKGADTSTYDECADLSWIVLAIERGTGSSPYQIMLFHHGKYTGTTTQEAVGFAPRVARVDDATIEVVYTWPYDHEGTANASGHSVSYFTWDEETESVLRTGELPPGVIE